MTDSSPKTIDTLLNEHRTFVPPSDFVASANVSDASIYDLADADYESWWASWAEKLQWDQKWDQVLDWQLPYAKWFVGGKLNASVQCLDRHVDAGNGERVAFYFEGEPGDTQTLTYSDMLAGVCQVANGLKSLGVGKGDRVTLYMPMVPELAMTVLACARIGAIFSVVFAGFSPTSLKDRVQDQAAKLIVCADGSWRGGKVLDLKKVVNEAVVNCPSVENVLLWPRGGELKSAAKDLKRDVQ